MLLAGCQHGPHHAQTEAQTIAPTVAHVNAPVAVYSTYLSDKASEQCAALQNDNAPCRDDVIDAKTFLQALQDKQYFKEAVASAPDYDYEVLIANQAATIETGNTIQHLLNSATFGAYDLPRSTHYFTEVTVQWRGMEIHSQLFTLTQSTENSDAPIQLATQMLDNWWQHAQSDQVFTARYLFNALQASDYVNNMDLPATIDEFVRTDTQLYPDPFRGVISRYVHPDYDGALIDISVYPITQALSMGTEALLHGELEKDLEDANHIAQARSMNLIIDKPTQPFSVNSDGTTYSGYVLSMHAESDTMEPLFASTYVFRQNDKFIKFSTTFPTRVSDTLVSAAIPHVKVPEESVLMAALRQLSSNQQTAL